MGNEKRDMNEIREVIDETERQKSKARENEKEGSEGYEGKRQGSERHGSEV